MENCSPLLEAALKRAQKNLGHSFIHDEEIAARVLSVVNCPSNRAGARLLMSCMLAKKPVTEEIRDYARSKYDETGGVEIAVLDCVGFLRHFLHLFHRLRKDFLDQYQVLVLKESDSAVSQALKEAFLALRQAAESAD
jgi:hypothetical protein